MLLDLRGQFGQLPGLLGQLDGMLFDLRGQFGQLDGVFLDLRGQLDQLDSMLGGGFGQLFGYGAEIPGFRGKLGQLPGHSQQFGAQQPTTQGFGPFGLFIDDPVEVDDVVDGGRTGHSGSAPFGNHYTPAAAVCHPAAGKSPSNRIVETVLPPLSSSFPRRRESRTVLP